MKPQSSPHMHVFFPTHPYTITSADINVDLLSNESVRKFAGASFFTNTSARLNISKSKSLTKSCMYLKSKSSLQWTAYSPKVSRHPLFLYFLLFVFLFWLSCLISKHSSPKINKWDIRKFEDHTYVIHSSYLLCYIYKHYYWFHCKLVLHTSQFTLDRHVALRHHFPYDCDYLFSLWEYHDY